MRITWFGHACFRIETGRSVILIDPFLKGNPTFENSGISWDEATKGVTHVGLTHGHSDHAGDAAEICKLRGATLLAILELATFMQSKGAEKIELMNTGGTITTADFSFTLVNAVHSSSLSTPSEQTYLGNPNGIVIRANDGKTVYHMGDTDMFADMALIAEFYKPEIGIVPVGDRFTMGSKAAAFACKKFFSFKTIIPCHYGTFAGLIEPTADKFIAEMKGHNVVVPRVGEAMSV
jgi:L-ascorbate metabolism protein UlaG (beta-lactamase superfamily)